MTSGYQVCTNCLMDTTDANILFNEDGVCTYCIEFPEMRNRYLHGNAKDNHALIQLRDEIREYGKDNEYDCLLGLSGGADSSYLAYLVKEIGLRPLAIHFDTGWNSELAVENIETIVKKLDLDLITHVCDWEEMSDLQLSFFKASLPNCDIPQDHAIITVMYNTAAKFNIKYILSGHNFATESVLATAWGHTADDRSHLLGVHKKFSKRKLKKYPTQGFFLRFFYYPIVKGIKIVRLLNYTVYDKPAAMEILEKKLGWRKYPGKHYESIFTRFFQGYYLPYKFNFDKRKAHLSSLILNEAITREQGLKELDNEIYHPRDLEDDLEFVAKKLKIDLPEFKRIIDQPPRSHDEFPTQKYLFKIGVAIKRALHKLFGRSNVKAV